MDKKNYQMIPVSKLELNNGQIDGLPKNPRFIKDERFAALLKSIQDSLEFLEAKMLKVYPMDNGHYIVIGGNMRLRACKELGYKELPCYVFPVETPVEKLREFTIKDNLLFGQNDWDILANEFDVDELTDWGLECDFLNDVTIDDEKEEEKELPKDLSDEVEVSFRIEVTCADEAEQEELYNRFIEEGLTCRILTL